MASQRPAAMMETPLRVRSADSSDQTRRTWTAVLLGAIAISFVTALAGRDIVNPGGWASFARFWQASVTPELSSEFLALTLDAALTTLSYAVLGSLLSLALGLVGGVLAARSAWVSTHILRSRVAVGLSKGALSVPRGIHEALWGLLLVNVLGRDPLVAVLAIGIPYGAITAKVFAEILDEAPQQPFDTLRTSGARRASAMLYGLGPVTVRDLTSYAFYRFECSIRAAAILGLIGAGGLGYELSLSFRTLRYGEMWTLIYALVMLSGTTDLWSSRVRHSLSGLGSGNRLPLNSVAGFVLLCTVAVLHLEIDISTLWSGRALEQVGFVGSSLWPPAFPTDTWPDMLRACAETIQMSIIATAIAASGGALVGALIEIEPRRHNLVRRMIGTARLTLAKATLLLCRAIPPPVWALLCLFVLLPGVIPGAIALGIYNFGILGRLMHEAGENLDPRPRAALQAIGVSGPASFLYGTAPRLRARYLALSLYRWEVTTRETVIVGVVGAGGIGRLLTDDLAAFDFPAVAGSLIALVVVTLLVDAASASARNAFR